MNNDFLNSIYYKSLIALYRLNINKDGRAKSIIIDAIWEALIIGKEGLNKAIMEMALETATEDWLDFWGSFYGVYRLHLEEDDNYRKRIIEEIISPKSTIPALQKATSRYLRNIYNMNVSEESVNIFEPWTHLLKFDDRGTLDGDGRMISYDYWNYAVIDISIPDATLITQDLIKYLNKIKAGGVKIYFSVSPPWDIIKDPEYELKRYRAWRGIFRETYLHSNNATDAFIILRPGDLTLLKDTDRGGMMDSHGVLEGSQKIFWDGVIIERTLYATGPIRNFLNSGVLSLESYAIVAENENLTIGEAIALEEESLLNGEKLTVTQNYIEIQTILTIDKYKDLAFNNDLENNKIYHILEE